MKKSWAFRKDQEAVSPVIATILLVAITVVLAAVLYVLALSFVIPPPTTGVITFVQHTTETNYTLTVVSIQGTTAFLSECFVMIIDANGNTSISTTLDDLNGTWVNNARFVDVDQDGRITVPDYFQLRKGAEYYDVDTKLILSNLAGTSTYSTMTII
ncbi:MAG: type IV pilin N-terminal domain-containing protein [Thermoplasmata archaeon]|nr:type IV pilin N-terminal domain-containing protein [Thermoplasmata archaeon]